DAASAGIAVQLGNGLKFVGGDCVAAAAPLTMNTLPLGPAYPVGPEGAPMARSPTPSPVTSGSATMAAPNPVFGLVKLLDPPPAKPTNELSIAPLAPLKIVTRPLSGIPAAMSGTPSLL